MWAKDCQEIRLKSDDQGGPSESSQGVWTLSSNYRILGRGMILFLSLLLLFEVIKVV